MPSFGCCPALRLADIRPQDHLPCHWSPSLLLCSCRQRECPVKYQAVPCSALSPHLTSSESQPSARPPPKVSSWGRVGNCPEQRSPDTPSVQRVCPGLPFSSDLRGVQAPSSGEETEARGAPPKPPPTGQRPPAASIHGKAARGKGAPWRSTF